MFPSNLQSATLLNSKQLPMVAVMEEELREKEEIGIPIKLIKMSMR